MRFEQSATKRSVLEKLLEQSMVLVTIDARAEGVAAPEHLVGDPQLRLNLSHRFGLPMEIDEWGIHATLTFSGTPFTCRLPWKSIYLVVSHATGQPFLFPADIPAEMAAEFSEVSEPEIDGSPEDADKGPALSVVTAAESEPGSGSGSGSDDEPPPKSPARRGHLRVVK